MGHETKLQTMTYLEEFDDVLLAKTIEDALSWPEPDKEEVESTTGEAAKT